MDNQEERLSVFGRFARAVKVCGIRVAVVKIITGLLGLKGVKVMRPQDIAELKEIAGNEAVKALPKADLFVSPPQPKPIHQPVRFDINKSYPLPSILLESENPKTYEIVCCTFRIHDPSAGLSGGPNGVLNVQREVFGERYRGLSMRYIFQPKEDINYPEHLETALKNVTHIVKLQFYAAYFIEYYIAVWSRRTCFTDMFFICHDLGSAYGAYLRGCRYILIWHTQGSLQHERESFGAAFTDYEKYLLNRLEEDVFINAEAVYFPSAGAKDSFISTTNIDCAKVTFGEPLYNTIPDAPPVKDGFSRIAKIGIEKVDRENTDIFLSVGDFSENKGIDRVPLFLTEYAGRTEKSVYWIAIGSKHKSGIYETLLENKDLWNFKATLIGERVDHDTLLALMDYADFYIMFHRHSIFDFATLEAMRAGKGLILNKAGGNLEVNTNNNVVYVDLENVVPAVEDVLTKDKFDFGALNLYAFENNFSKKQFFNSYANVIDRHLYDVIKRKESDVNNRNLSEYKNLYKNKIAVICGAGSSLNKYRPLYGDDIIHIALNRALFCWNIKYDFLFMQDSPKNQPYTLDDYNIYNCDKFYGRITNPSTKNMGIEISGLDPGKIKGRIIEYELMPRWYDVRVDVPEFEIDRYCMADAQSVLFSALQFVVYAGCNRIVLYGIEFSSSNFNNEKNPNIYNVNAVKNLISFKKYIKDHFPDIEFVFGATENDVLHETFKKIDLGEEIEI